MKAIKVGFWYGRVEDKEHGGEDSYQKQVEVIVSGAHAAVGHVLDTLLGQDLGNPEIPRRIVIEPMDDIPAWVTRKSEQPMLTVCTGAGDNERVKDVIHRHVANIERDMDQWLRKLGRDDEDLDLTVGEAREQGLWKP